MGATWLNKGKIKILKVKNPFFLAVEQLNLSELKHSVSDTVRLGVFIMHGNYCADPAAVLRAPSEPNKETASWKRSENWHNQGADVSI